MANEKVQKGTAITVEMLEASEINEVRLGGKVIGLRVIEGQQKKDREGNPLFNPDGSPQVWNDSYYVDFSFQGGETSFKVDADTYSALDLNKRYQFVGRAYMKTPYGEGKPYLSIEPVRFDFLF